MPFEPFEKWANIDLTAGPRTIPVENGFFTQDNQANLLGIRVLKNGVPRALSGTVGAYVKFPDGTTLSAIQGTIGGDDNNEASVLLPAEAYSQVGSIEVTIYNKDGNPQKVLAVFYGYVHRTRTDSEVTPPLPVPDISQIISQYEQMVEATEEAQAVKNGALRFDISQSLTDAQKTQAQTNAGVIGAIMPAGQVMPSNVSSFGSSVENWPLNRIFGIASNITASHVTDLPEYGVYGMLVKETAIYPNGIFVKYTYTNALQHAYTAWELNQSSEKSPWVRMTTSDDIKGIDAVIAQSINLFDKNTITRGYWLNHLGSPMNLSGYFYSDYIEVTPGQVYKIYAGTSKENSYTGDAHFCTYSENKTFIADKSKVYTYTAESGVRYIRFSDKDWLVDGLMIINTSKMPDDFYPYERYKETTAVSVKPESIQNVTFKPSTNLFNAKDILNGYVMEATSNNLYVNSKKFVSHKIPVTAGATYWIGPFAAELIVFYNANHGIVSSLSNKNGSFTVPSGAVAMRFCQAYATSGDAPERMMVVQGSVELRNEDYYIYGVNARKYNRLYTLSDAIWHWSHNEKFPIGFIGDSTCEGAGTSLWAAETAHQTVDEAEGAYGSIDYELTTSYSYILQQMIREELNVSNARVYNMAYSGTQYEWIIPKLKQLISGVYSDVKLVGLSYGINDRNLYYSMSHMFYQEFRNNVIYVINFLHDHGIQPFFVTTQALVAPYTMERLSTLKLRTAYHAEVIANQVMRELSEEFNIELIDMNNFGAHLLQYSGYTAAQIIPDRLHFNDLGTKLEAQFLFASMIRRCITVTDSRLLTFIDQYIKSEVYEEKLTPYTGTKAFKMAVNYTRSEAAESVMMDFWIYNKSNCKLNLTSYCFAVGAQHAVIDGTDIPITSTTMDLGLLDIGIHHIVVKSGNTTKWDWIGFELEKERNTTGTLPEFKTYLGIE